MTTRNQTLYSTSRGSSPDQQSIDEYSIEEDNGYSANSRDISLSSHERQHDEHTDSNDSSCLSYIDSYFIDYKEDDCDSDSDISDDQQSRTPPPPPPPPPPPILRHRRQSISLNRNRSRFSPGDFDETDLIEENRYDHSCSSDSGSNNHSESCSSSSFANNMNVSQRLVRLKHSIQSLSQRTLILRVNRFERIWNSDHCFIYLVVCIFTLFGGIIVAYGLYHHDMAERIDAGTVAVPIYAPTISAPPSANPLMRERLLPSYTPSRSPTYSPSIPSSPSAVPSNTPSTVPSSAPTISLDPSSIPTQKQCTCSPREYHWTLNFDIPGCPLSIATRNGIQGQSICGYSNNEHELKPIVITEVSIKELIPWTFDVYREHTWQNKTLRNGANLTFTSLTESGIIIGGLEGRITANSSKGEFEHFFRLAFSNVCEIVPFGVGDSLGFFVFTQVSEPIPTSCYYKTTSLPSMTPSSNPIHLPSSKPSNIPSSHPTLSATYIPSLKPTDHPSWKASAIPSTKYSYQPSPLPTMANTWIPIGNVMYGTASLQEYGKSVAISKDGKVMAISQHRDDRIDVYDYDNDTESWNKRNISIKGESGSGMGQVIAMSENGTRIAGGGTKWNDERGVVQVWDWDGISWNQVGYSFRGINAKDTVGVSLAMSGDGNHLIIGAGDYESNGRRGSVIIFWYDGLNWTKKGYHITGSHQYDYMGCNPDSVSVTDDGNYIAMGAQAASYVKVYFWDGNMWKLLDIINHDAYTWFGISVELLTVDGKLIIAIGSPKDPPNGSIYVYEWNANGRIERPGSPIQVEEAKAIGYSLAFSADGNTLMSQSNFSPLVFDWNGFNYSQRGGPIFIAGDEHGDQLVGIELPIAISGCGNIVVVGLPFDEVGWLSCPCQGHARSFAWKRL